MPQSSVNGDRVQDAGKNCNRSCNELRWNERNCTEVITPISA